MGLLIDMIPVGQGDSFLVTIDSPNGEVYVLIDAGLPEAGKTVQEYVTQYAPTGLDAIFATHIDNDHVGGMATVLHHCNIKPNAPFVFNVPPAIKERWTPIRNTLERYKGTIGFKRIVEAVDTVKTLCALANQRGMVAETALQGRGWNAGDVKLTVLNPTLHRLSVAWEESRLDKYIKEGWSPQHIALMESSGAPQTSAENDSSIVLEISHKGIPCALMTSDAGAAVLKDVTANKHYDFLKVPHHGSDTGMDNELIKQIRPSTAFIPVGENAHGHPCIEVLDLLRGVGAKTYCSTKTNNCRKSCERRGGVAISHAIGRPHHSNWTTIDTSQCQNNNGATRA